MLRLDEITGLAIVVKLDVETALDGIEIDRNDYNTDSGLSFSNH